MLSLSLPGLLPFALGLCNFLFFFLLAFVNTENELNHRIFAFWLFPVRTISYIPIRWTRTYYFTHRELTQPQTHTRSPPRNPSPRFVCTQYSYRIRTLTTRHTTHHLYDFYGPYYMEFGTYQRSKCEILLRYTRTPQNADIIYALTVCFSVFICGHIV